jgi:hypothetical protein
MSTIIFTLEELEWVKKYAEANNYAYCYEDVKKIPENRHHSWAKVLLFAKYSKDYDWVLWISNKLKEQNNIVEYLKANSNESHCIFMNELIPSVILINCKNKVQIQTLLNDWWNEEEEPFFWNNLPAETNALHTILPSSQIHIKNKVTNDYLRLCDKWKVRQQKQRKQSVCFIIKFEPLTINTNYDWIYLLEVIEYLGYIVDVYATNIVRNIQYPLIHRTIKPYITDIEKKYAVFYSTVLNNNNKRQLNIQSVNAWYPIYNTKYESRQSENYTIVVLDVNWKTLSYLNEATNTNLKSVYLFDSYIMNNYKEKLVFSEKIKYHKAITVEDLLKFFGPNKYIKERVYFMVDSLNPWIYDLVYNGFNIIHSNTNLIDIGQMFESTDELINILSSEPSRQTLNNLESLHPSGKYSQIVNRIIASAALA